MFRIKTMYSQKKYGSVLNLVGTCLGKEIFPQWVHNLVVMLLHCGTKEKREKERTMSNYFIVLKQHHLAGILAD